MDTLKKLNKAIEAENMEDIENIMKDIPNIEPDIDVREFSNLVKNKCHKEANNMKRKLSMKIFVAVAAVVTITCVSVGAATLLSQFTFFKDGNYVTVTSNENLEEKEAEKLADEVLEEEVKSDETTIAKEDVFNTINEAEEAYNMKVIMPENMPKLNLSELRGTQFYVGDNSNSSTIWATYGDADTKAFGLTVTKNDFNNSDDVTSISKTDAEGSGEKYNSLKGYSFNKLYDRDDTSNRTAEIYTISIGNYEYNMIFFGFDENEIENVVNSVDLKEYE